MIAEGVIAEHPAWEDLILAENLTASLEELDAHLGEFYAKLQTIALAEFGDIVDNAQVMTLPTGDPLKLRLDLAQSRRCQFPSTVRLAWPAGRGAGDPGGSQP